MKKIIALFLILFNLVSCEDVIDVETPTDTPRLVVDAFIRVDTSQSLTNAKVNVGISSSFFDEIPPAKLDRIIITNIDAPNTATNPNQLQLFETSPGQYERLVDTSFFTEGRLVLYIEFEGKIFAANTSYVPSAPITNLTQGEATLFEGNETEILVSFNDIPNRDDYYLLDFDFFEYLVTEDLFYKGQSFEFSYFYDDEVDTGTEINVSLLGIDLSFYNYMNLLINQSSGSQGPFQIPVATVRGNILNITDVDANTIDLNNIDQYNDQINTEDFALGYFAVSQFYVASITIE